MRTSDPQQEFVEDGQAVQVVGRGLQVLVHEMEQLEKEVFPLPHQFYERVRRLQRATGRLLHY
jgi:hypothetical protein